MIEENITHEDNVFKYLLIDILKPYTEASRKWWADFENRSFPHPTTHLIKDGPPGFYEKCSRSPRQSVIYGVQAYPIVSVSRLKLPKMLGGPMQAVEEIVKRGLTIDEFTILSRKGLQSTLLSGLFLCYVPTEMLKMPRARWIYMRPTEILEVSRGILPNTFIKRVMPHAADFEPENDTEDLEPENDSL